MFPIILILTLALLVALALVVLLPKRQLPPEVPRFQLSERASHGLFDDTATVACKDNTEEELRSVVLDRANAGDMRTLTEAHSMQDTRLYGEVLDALIEQTSARQETFERLVSHILEDDDLRANSNLANRLIEQFSKTPERRRTAETLHIAALSDDAATFERAVNTILRLWSRGRIPELSAVDLRKLFESEYWVISPEVRRSGACFALKRRLAEVRRQLAIANRRA